jgi:uncharacterized protein YndB with AHSA1/START domain
MTPSSSSGPTTLPSSSSSRPGRTPRSRRAGSSAPEALGAGYDLDFRVGGREAFVGGPPGATVHTYESRFHDIVPEQRIVYTYEMYADETRISVSVATVEFQSVGDVTRLVLTEQGVFLDGHDTAAQREEGTRTFLESLAVSLSGDAS